MGEALAVAQVGDVRRVVVHTTFAEEAVGVAGYIVVGKAVAVARARVVGGGHTVVVGGAVAREKEDQGWQGTSQPRGT